MLHGIRLRRNHRRFAFTARVLALAMALDAVTAIRGVAAPADIFDIAAPTIGSEPPKAADIKEGDASVSTMTGALEYSFPIPVPPGRNGMEPHLGLSYSSQAPIYGGVATGWSLSVPIITLDTTPGTLLTQSTGTDHFTSSMAGGRPLIPFDEPAPDDVLQTFRAQNDATFTRYQRIRANSGTHALWRALTTDGMTYEFGGDNVGTCTIISAGYAPLTRAVDSFGNEVDYVYKAGVDGECLLSTILWGSNANAGLGNFAGVSFSYSTPSSDCPSGVYIGSQTSYRTGTKIVTGASRLDTITAVAVAPSTTSGGGLTLPPPEQAVHTRVITLSYAAPAGTEQTATCSATHAAYRTLYSIQESAWGIDSPRVDLPPVTFAYGSAQFGSGELAYASSQRSTTPWTPSADHHMNLGWGRRSNSCSSSAPWPTVEAMMLDIDGDGRADRVVSAPQPGPDGRLTCGADWYRNTGLDTDWPLGGHIALPTLKWASSGGTCDYSGSSEPHSVTIAGTAVQEGCSLNYQITGYVNSTSGAPMDHCPSNGAACPATCTATECSTMPISCSQSTGTSAGTDCGRVVTPGPSYLAYRWMDFDGDGRVDIVASPAGGMAYNLQKGNGVPSCGVGPDEPDLLGTGGFPVCPSPTFTSNPVTGYTMCNGMSPWAVYLNRHGQMGLASDHALADGLVYQPIPLETDSGDSSLTSSPVGQTSGTVDIDGDGFEDGVYSRDDATAWDVYRYFRDLHVAGIGGFQPASGSTAFSYPTGSSTNAPPINESVFVPISTTGKTFNFSAPETLASFFDLNGDGLADRWHSTQNDDGTLGGTVLDYNIGTSFSTADEVSMAVRPSTDGFACPPEPSDDVCCKPSTGGTCKNGSSYILSGDRIDTNRALDLDGDGRTDVTRLGANATNGFPDLTATPTSFLNQGGTFTSGGVSSVQDTQALANRIIVRGSVGNSGGTCTGDLGESPYWEIRSDMIDLDGDGIAEGVDFGSDPYSTPSTMSLSRIATPTAPPRLLVSIDNGRGAMTTASYASTQNSDVVTQDSANGKTTPHTMWVVQSLTTRDDLTAPAATTTTTSYLYKNPHFGPDDGSEEQPHYGFRGFEEVTTTAQTGAMTVQRYGYDPDWSGRLTTTIVMPRQGAPETTVDDEVRSIDDTTWEARGLQCDHLGLNCAITTFHATQVDHFTCKNGQDELACRANTDTFTRTVSTTTALRSSLDNSGPYLWKETSARLTTDAASTSALEGDRITDSTYFLAADPATYRLLPQSMTKSVIAGGVPTTYAKTSHTFDPNHLVAITDEVWFDGDDSHRAIVKRAYDLMTGNVLQRWKPVQNPDAGGDGASSTFDYDSRHLFVVAEHLEAAGVDGASQEIDHRYEYGTGNKLETLGPNVAPCQAQADCPSGSPAQEDHRIRVDGLGRMIERYETFMDNGGDHYASVLVEKDAYVDGKPSSVTRQSAIDGGLDSSPLRYAVDETDLDGHGRPSKKTVFANGAAAGDAITTFQYNDDGTLGAVTLPDPSANDSSVVQFSYFFDSLGRPTKIRRPDSGDSPSGVDMQYDGLVTTSTEVVGASLGNAASTTTTKDAFGRLRFVDEQTAAGPTFARTVYDYDAADNVRQVTDPEGVATAMTHDFAGHRTSITRPNARTWTYMYNKNGDMIAEVVPGAAADQSDVASFTTTLAYDDLDRPTSKAIAPRNLSAADLALFGSGTEVFQYDGSGGNAVGRLASWGAFAPGASSPMLASNPTWNAQGQPQLTNQAINGVAGSPALQRSFNRSYYVSGAMAGAYYFDLVGAGTTSTFSQVMLDAKGLPSQIELVTGLDDPSAPFSYIANTRNVAGLVTNQQPAVGGNGATVPPLQSQWTYDRLGRVTSQHVLSGPANTLVAGQELAYFGNDDPKTLDQYLPTGHKQFSFGFDMRHQITSAAETTTAGYFSASYAFGAAGRFTHATEASFLPPGSDVKPRDVEYQYADGTAGLDPEEVVGLNSADGSTFAQYEYDAVGNMIYRCEGRIADHAAHDHTSHAPTICAGSSVHFDYDGKDQLRRAIAMNNGAVAGTELYWYDENGRRTITVKLDKQGNPTEMIWWIGDTEAHYDSSSTVTHIFSYLTMGGAVGRVDRITDTTTNIEYEFHGLGNSTLAAIDQLTGSVNTSFSYTPFGEILEATASDGMEGVNSHRRRWNDKYLDDASGLAYYGARYYDKTLIGWTQGDPLYRFAPDARWTAPRRGNLYAYSLNNPLSYMDPDGLAPPQGGSPVQSPGPSLDAVDPTRREFGGRILRMHIEQAEKIEAEVAFIVDAILNNRGDLKVMQAAHGGAQPVAATDQQRREIASLIGEAAELSEHFRAVIEVLIAGGSEGATRRSNVTQVVVIDKGATETLPNVPKQELVNAGNKIGVHSNIFFNGNDLGKITSNGTVVAQNIFAAFAHETFHAWQQVTGRQTDTMSLRGYYEREDAATQFENLFRSEANSSVYRPAAMGPRDCYAPPCK